MVDFTIPVDHRVKLKENEIRDKYQDLARDMKKLWNMKVQSSKDWHRDWRTWKLWNMKVTVIPIVIHTLGTVTKGVIKI